ncbi:penicillin acylase family protein [Pseudoxanthomonas composti]|uniref:Penicillin acylase family protein n=1 Tax=Pseudoxanthomonas composti TaxID=2137479 RepID=A0A4Q1K1B2_9GAMM|nr:penicillin acylase family protein [Pseudoxanthomonas composti]RXR08376.1 penicillin acylase family protein [Pseudoxanthomonas composti]
MLKWTRRLLGACLILVVLAALSVWWLLKASLPTLEGDLPLAGLSAPVSVQRDALGVVTIEAGNEADMARALGYVHAQERYFEMDLMRRTSAGELAELFGPVAVDVDRRNRLHRMRARVEAHLDAFAGPHRDALRAYTEGVNAGLQALRVRPWPYLLLRQAPRPWSEADSALTGYAMYFDLQDAGNRRELQLAQLRARMPDALYRLLTHPGSSWDAPLLGEAFGDAALPTATELDMRRMIEAPAQTVKPGASARVRPPASRAVTTASAAQTPAAGRPPAAEESAPGSNNFAVAGRLSATGSAIVADDMHLALRAPNLWFRARLRYADPQAAGGQVDVGGFTLPGLPAVIVGSNGHVAWGFTNAYVDTADWFAVAPCRDGGRAPCDAVQRHRERILVAGAAPVDLEIVDTAYGPVREPAAEQPALSLRWVAHLPGALNLGLMEFPRAGDLPQLLGIADHTATPAQNLVAGDARGHIAWRVLGALPQREGACNTQTLIEPLAPQGERCAPWGFSLARAPQLLDPDNGRLWTANARVVDRDGLTQVGDAGYALGARARQIRDDLLQRERFDEQQLLAIQLDDRAVFLQRWWALLQQEAAQPGSQALAQLAQAAHRWSGQASIDSVSYRLVREWRDAVHARVLDGFMAAADVQLDTPLSAPQLEGVVWPLLQQRPAHLLPAREACGSEPTPACDARAGWHALLEAAAREVTEGRPAAALGKRSWGQRNTAVICHPLAAALPGILRPHLCMPAEPLPGDIHMPRVQGPSFGASQRMVVSPGHEAAGLIHMPGGQSGHPLSPFWGAGHEDWVHGRPTPFLPGASVYTLTLRPAAGD